MIKEPIVFTSLQQRLSPKHTALIIIDMQKDFCWDGFATSKAGRPLAAAQALIPRLELLRQAANNVGALVIHVGFETYTDHKSDSGSWLLQRRRARHASDKIAVSGTEGIEFIPELTPQEGELMVMKHRYSAFKGTDLELLLRAHRIETVVPTGVSTNACVESTYRDAFEYGFYVCLPEDGCASWDMSLHNASLKTADARFAEVTQIEKIIACWNNA